MSNIERAEIEDPIPAMFSIEMLRPPERNHWRSDIELPKLTESHSDIPLPLPECFEVRFVNPEQFTEMLLPRRWNPRREVVVPSCTMSRTLHRLASFVNRLTEVLDPRWIWSMIDRVPEHRMGVLKIERLDPKRVYERKDMLLPIARTSKIDALLPITCRVPCSPRMLRELPS
jgi:hypothetical protein